MKKITFPFTMLVLALLVLSACTDQGTAKDQPCALSNEDSSKIKAWNQLFAQPKTTAAGLDIFARPVSHRLANECVARYIELYKEPNCPEVQRAYIEGVSFFGDELQDWLKSLPGNVDFTHVRMVLGVYTENFVRQNGLQADKTGKLTVFVWPYKGNDQAVYLTAAAGRAAGDTASVFNLGELHP